MTTKTNRMKIKILITIAVLSLLSCQKKIELNKYNFETVKDYAIDCIQRNDSISFMELFSLESESFKSKFPDQNQELKKIIFEQFAETQRIFQDSNIQYLKYDFLDAIEGGKLIDNNSFNIYVKSNDNYYKLRFITYNGNLENAESFYTFYLSNLSSECREFETKPYTPITLSKHELLWDNLGQKTFNFVALRLYNLTPYTIEKVKYRISITRNEDDMLIFMKTLESEVNINEGDVGDMVIDGLKGVHLGAELHSDENFSWSVDILDVFPKPLKNPCEKIEILKQME